MLDYDQYNYYCCIYLDHDLINLSFGSNLNQQVEASFALSHFERHPAAFTYDKNTGEIIDWGHAAEETFETLKSSTDNEIAEERSQSSCLFQRSILAEIHRLYQSQEENKQTIDPQDEIRFKAIGKFLGAVCKQVYDNSTNQLANTHFIFILPAEWDHNIRTQFIPRLFQYGGITSTKDPQNRIMFTTVLESTVAAMQEDRYYKEYGIQFLREEKYLHCDLYLHDLESPTELVLQAFQVEDEQTLTDSTTLFKQTRRLLVPKLARNPHGNMVKLSSCKAVALDFKSKADTLMEDVSKDWKENVQSCLDEISSFDQQEVDKPNPDVVSCATLIHSKCAEKRSLSEVIRSYLGDDDYRQINTIIITLHDNLPVSQRKFSDLYYYCVRQSLSYFLHARIQLIGESRWASPQFGGPEIIRGGLFRLLETLKFANTEGSPSIENIHGKVASGHRESEAVHSISPFVCEYNGCDWAFVHLQDTDDHRLLHDKAKLKISDPTSDNPQTYKRQDYTQGHEQSLFLLIDVTIDITQISLSLFDQQYKTCRKINLVDSCLVGLPPLSYFISISENGSMFLTTTKIFFDLVNNIYHQAFHKFCNDNSNGEIFIHNLEAFSSKFTFDHYYRYFANSDLVWSSNQDKNKERVGELEKIFYHNNNTESSEHTSANPIHVITFILIYVGYVYHKMDLIKGYQLRKVLQDIQINPESKAVLVLQGFLLNLLPLDALNNPEVVLKLCGFRGNLSELSSSKNEFSLWMLQESLWSKMLQESLLTKMLQESLLTKNDEPITRSYYGHATISEEIINLELNQIIPTTTAKGVEMMPLLLKHHLMKIDQPNESICKRIWMYIWNKQDGLIDKDGHLYSMTAKGYSSFKVNISSFIGKILRLSKHAQNSRGSLGSFYDRKYQFEYHSDYNPIDLSLREIVEVAIRPSMRGIAISILSVFKNIDAFALYNAETVLVTGELLSPYHSFDYRALVSSILQKELLESIRSGNLNMDMKFRVEPASTDMSIESLDKVLYLYQERLKKRQISTRSRHNYALKFNFAQDLLVEEENDEQQLTLECSNKDCTRIPANYLYVLLTQRTKLCQFSRYFKTELGNATDLESIDLVKFEESGEDVANPGDSILAVSVSYTIVHKFEIEKVKDLRLQGFPLILNVTPLHYLSLLEVSLEAEENEKQPISHIMIPSLLREKQTLSYETWK
ncbi:hypothetical protein MBANPS3_000918 [Mucor bainieri]